MTENPLLKYCMEFNGDNPALNRLLMKVQVCEIEV